MPFFYINSLNVGIADRNWAKDGWESEKVRGNLAVSEKITNFVKIR